MLHHPAIDAAEEIDAGVGIVFPAVLAVENDAHQRGPVAGVAAGGVADGLQLADEIVHRLLRRVALVVEADLVAHGVVAEDDLQRLALLFHAPRAVEHLGIAEVAVAVARDPAVGRAGEDLLVGADPLDAGLGDGRDDALADRAFRGPHAPRLLPEQLFVELDRPAEMLAGVFGVAFEVLGQHHVGHRPPRQPLVPQQRQDRMVEGRGRQLHLPALQQLAVQRHHLPEQLHLLVQQPLLLLLGPVAALVAELGQLGVVLEGQRVDPHQVRPALQVDEVLLAEPLAGPLGRIDPQAALLVQLVVARIGPDHLVRMDHEEVVQQIVQVVFAQAVGRQPRHPQVRVLVAAVGVGQQLLQAGWAPG